MRETWLLTIRPNLHTVFSNSYLRRVHKVNKQNQCRAINLTQSHSVLPRLCEFTCKHRVEVVTACGKHHSMGGNLDAVIGNQMYVAQ